jgi:hypothetical protein
MKLSALLLPSLFAFGVTAEAPTLARIGALLDCGVPCTTQADCVGCTNWCQTTENGGIVSQMPLKFSSIVRELLTSQQCHPHLNERSAEFKPASLMKKEVDICYGSCGGADDADCPPSCPYCWPTRVGGKVI